MRGQRRDEKQARRPFHELDQRHGDPKQYPAVRQGQSRETEVAGVHQRTAGYLSGDELFHQDDYGDAAYVILQGEAEILVDTPRRAIKIATLGKNEIIGEIAILCDVPRTATVVAHSDLDTLRVSKEGFFHLVTEFPQVGVEVMSALASKLHRTTEALTAVCAKLDELDKRSCGG
jgi:CRP-like cAMP-binding protein